jgi:hypothetical protein
MKKLLICFSAGCLGALVNSLALWVAGDLGVTSALGVSLAPALTHQWIYPRIVWGGLWGFLFILPLMQSKVFSKGVVMSLFPTLFQLLVVFPHMANKGMFGLALGTLTPIFVFIFNAIWGVVTAITIKLAR